MNKGLLIFGLSAAAVFAGIKFSQAAKAVENIYDKLKYSYSNIRLKLSKGNVSMALDVNITNLANVSIPVKNIMVQAKYLKNGIYKDLAVTRSAIKEVVIQANTTSTIKDITLEVNAGILAWNTFLAIIGEVTELLITSTYYVAGFQQTYDQKIPLKISKQSGTSGTDDEQVILFTPSSVSETILAGLKGMLS